MAKDPYRYFRIEAHDLLEGLLRDILSIEERADVEAVRRLLRHAHTLKGAARVVKQHGIAEHGHALEDVLGPHRKHGGPLPSGEMEKALALLDDIRAQLSALDGERPAPRRVATPLSSDENLRSVRVDVEQLDALLAHILEAKVAGTTLQSAGRLLQEARRTAHTLVDDLHAGRTLDATPRAERLLEVVEEIVRTVPEAAGDVNRELQQLSDAVAELRLIPAHGLTNDLQRAVRDAASTLQKEVLFSLSGAEVAIDANVLSALRAALLHIVRNAVAHGMESPEERLKNGKGARGTVELSISRRGQRVVFSCRDDGRGLDVEAIRRAAVARGLLAGAGAREVQLPALIQLLLRGGVSTTSSVTEVSGRGVGLDVVRDTIERLNGEVEIRSEPGRGTTVELVVPVSLSSMPTLCVDVDGATVLLPLDSVKRTIGLSSDDIIHTADGNRIIVDDVDLAYLPLARLLSPDSPSPPRVTSAVVLEAGRSRAAFGVARLLDVRSVLVRGLPAHLEADATVAGAAIGDDGVPQLILAPLALVEAATQAQGAVEEHDAAPRRLPLLVIDDSLTTRMLEKSILESAGYEVDLAVSAEEALKNARKVRYGMFIVDVEMPGMSGFEFIAATRADPALKDIPSILVTSRDDVEDKRRGKEVGALGYIVKGHFDQRELLALIRRWVG